MKIPEIVNGIHCYVATVRIKGGKTATTAKTIIYSENATQARNLLTAMYCDDSVISVSKVSKSDLNETSVNQFVANRTTTPQATKPISRILPTAYKDILAKKALLRLMKRNSLKIKPTVDDLKSAYNDFDAEQKRVNGEYENKLKWDEIRYRNKSRRSN